MPSHDRHPGHGHHHRAHDRHGNPRDLARYVAQLDDPQRDRWQKPTRVLRALGIRPGMTVAEIGAGTGYFTLRLSRAVTSTGRVFAVDVEPRLLVDLRERILREGARNVTPVLALDDDPLLPAAALDLVLLVNVFHHFSEGSRYLRRLRGTLRRGGRIANIDFSPGELPVGPALAHRVDPEAFLRQARAAGLREASRHTFLPYQYFLTLAPRAGQARRS